MQMRKKLNCRQQIDKLNVEIPDYAAKDRDSAGSWKVLSDKEAKKFILDPYYHMFRENVTLADCTYGHYGIT